MVKIAGRQDGEKRRRGALLRFFLASHQGIYDHLRECLNVLSLVNNNMVRVLFSSLLRESFFLGLGFLRNRSLLESPGNSVDLRYERVFYTDLVF